MYHNISLAFIYKFYTYFWPTPKTKLKLQGKTRLTITVHDNHYSSLPGI
jgi:hypothetical protein